MSDRATIDALAAADLAPLFWPPARLDVESAWYGHVPFAHWLVAAQKPRVIVELGTHNGVSFAAFCEPVLRYGIDSRAIAIDTWRGDEHAGFYGDHVHESLLRFTEARYGGFASLLRMTFDDALARLPPASIDLLHIDGRHRYEDVSHDFNAWRDRLTERAVILFHDIEERQGDFGVWRFWQELRADFPAFAFTHGHGLGVLAVGAEVAPPIAALCRFTEGETIAAIRGRFAALGERWVTLRRQQELEAQLRSTQEWAERAQAEVNRLFPLHRSTQDRHRLAVGALSQARFDIVQLERRAQAAEDAIRAEAIEHATQRDSLQAELHAKSEALAASLHTLSSLQARLDAVLAHARAIETSRLWRLTSPARRVGAALRGKTVGAADLAALATTPEPRPVPSSPMPPPAASEQGSPTDAAPNAPAARRALFISGEHHTPGHAYRVERVLATFRTLGYEARWMEPEPVGPADLEGVTFVVLWRVPFSAHIQGIITVAHENGAQVIFDVDDLMFRPEFATIEIVDGIRSQKFSELETQAFFRAIGDSLKAADYVTCPTAELARHARQLGRPAYVVPNGFDDEAHREARRALRERVTDRDHLRRIGYAAGSRTHQRDFALILPAIVTLLKRHDDLRLVLFRDGRSGQGVVVAEEFPELAPVADRIEWRDMVTLSDLPRELARFDINLAPLEAGNPFCDAKSELKYWEAALAGVPTVASPTPPFRRAITHGVTGLLASDTAGWLDGIEQLLASEALRKRIARNAYHDALARFSPAARARDIACLLAEIAAGPEGAAAFERELYRHSRPRVAPPHIPDADTLFFQDRMRDAAVTVVVPVHNYMDMVIEALLSVKEQRLEEIDLLVVDDATPDDSTQIVLAWAHAHCHRFNRLLVLRHTENAGLGFARNTGFAAAETPFVLPLDADNRLRPEACDTLLGALETTEAAFAYPVIERFGAATGRSGEEPYSVLHLQRGNYIDAMALIRKSAWAEAGGYDHVRHGWEDYDFWCRLAECGRFGVQVDRVLADYRVHDRSMLHTTTEIRDNKNTLIADLERRHPWLDLPRKGR